MPNPRKISLIWHEPTHRIPLLAKSLHKCVYVYDKYSPLKCVSIRFELEFFCILSVPVEHIIVALFRKFERMNLCFQRLYVYVKVLMTTQSLSTHELSTAMNFWNLWFSNAT
jgi:hypothetical protein